MKKVLITGGRGYIGAHVVYALHNAGYFPIIFDDGSNTKQVIDPAVAPTYTGNLALPGSLEAVFNKHGDDLDGVIHLAGKISVGESFKDPVKYYKHNVSGTINLLEIMKAFDVKKIIFASSAGVYGDATVDGRREYVGGLYPPSPYGSTKLYGEEIIQKLGFTFNALRFFNVAGCDHMGRVGDTRYPSSHLMPAIIDSILTKTPIFLNGSEYDTPDGTCIRDYVHVSDVAHATVQAYGALEGTNPEAVNSVFNISSGKGASNLSVIQTAERLFDVKLDIRKAPGRRGDIDVLVGNNERAKKHLHYRPLYSNIETMLMTTYQFRRTNSGLIF